ncbi:uncharacterized protein LOC133183152 [Saccostrea echinata]|uniref:uncharacterized protein LOC133183152 n=1 Tax=Saccostrea echinata TaxID=191078 RepID=UPI002A807344|nr:uncharacterized protein LOC133183152 [Saccostrea echinata]
MESEYIPVYSHKNLGNGRVLLGFIFSVLGFLFFFGSFVIPRWNDFETEEYFGRGQIRLGRIGLWQNCKLYDDYDCDWNTGIPGIVAPQLFHSLAFVLFLVYWILLVRWQRQDKMPIRLLETALCSFATGFCLMLSFLTWITQLGTLFQYNLSIGFLFSIFSFVLMELTFVILFIESKQEARKRKPLLGEDAEESHYVEAIE